MVLACGNVEEAGVECRGRKTCGEGVQKEMELLGLEPEWITFRNVWTV